MDPKISLGSFQFLPSSVKVNGKPEIDEWIGPFQFALWCQRASPWWIGDMLLAGDAQFGEDFSQACEGLISGDQLQRYESIARRVPPSNRRHNLSWSAHAAVARLSYSDQKRMLLEAERRGWTSEELRKKARELVKK
jgi:hypothetical protein